MVTIPQYLTHWFDKKNWTIHTFQHQMFQSFAENRSTLLIAPTGGGKTLASFLPAIDDIVQSNSKGLHTLYISPLKALANDIQRNLLFPVQEMRLNISIELRTGDTSSYHRQRQLKKPPNILLTTPESLLLLLSYRNAEDFFKSLKLVIVDELHSLVVTKRGDLLSLALAQLSAIAVKMIRFGLSATVAEPKKMAQWLDKHSTILNIKSTKLPKVSLLTDLTLPYSGFKAKYAVPLIYKKVKQFRLSLIFTNTRSQAEFLFRELWLSNSDNLPIAIYHGSLSKEERLKTELLINTGKIRAVVTTSALELGIDWGNIDAVIQVGAPHTVNRLVQRIGRSNHRFNESSLAYIVPTNCFEAIEAKAAIDAIANGRLDKEEYETGALDVIIQFIINCACSQPVSELNLYRLVRLSYPYQKINRDIFKQLFQFAVNGGYVLQHYEQYNRLVRYSKNSYVPASPKVIRRHRQNIGTIIESARLRVKVLNKRTDKILGDIEESFVQNLIPGDTFLFAGEVLEYLQLHDLFVETKKVNVKQAKIPSYTGGSIMPLSSFLANEVLALLNKPSLWMKLPSKVCDWLVLQQQFSSIPTQKNLLIEQFSYKKQNRLIIYSFEGKKANNSLGMLLTRYLEKNSFKPLSFTTTDYGVMISTLKTLSESAIKYLFSTNVLHEEFEDWLANSTLLKRCFRQVAVITGLTERQVAGQHKSMKQVTFSTDLIYDVLRQHEPDHILLKITRSEVEKIMVNIDRLEQLLSRLSHQIKINFLVHPSPFSIPLLTIFSTEKIKGSAEEEMLDFVEREAQAVQLMKEVQEIV